jgi:hypothetical protein
MKQVLDIKAPTPAADPVWMNLADDGVTVTLSVPSELNGVKQDKIHLRSPCVREVRACQAAHPNDEHAVDAMLFASLASVSEKDVLNLTVKDYNRVHRSYFRLVEEDDI